LRSAPRIDRTARDRGLTRSACISDLARRDLDAQIGPGADPKVHEALDQLRALSADAEFATDEDDANVVLKWLSRTSCHRGEKPTSSTSPARGSRPA
jgi:hypothetical protein